jgi:hypothetical protein
VGWNSRSRDLDVDAARGGGCAGRQLGQL